MKYLHNKILLFTFFIVISSIFQSCIHKEPIYVDFENAGKDNPLSFHASSVVNTTISNKFPDNCYLPDAIPVNEYEYVETEEDNASSLRTSSVSMTSIVQRLLEYANGNKVVEIVGTYASVGCDGKKKTLSGKVVLPADGKIKNYILVSHYTICSNTESPSNAFPLEAVLCSAGYAIIVPDYIGYGLTQSDIHPYLVMDLTAKNVFDMYRACKIYLNEAGYQPQSDEIYLMGYSQGGANTMALQRLIETEHPDIKIKRVFAGGGPYNVKATYEKFVTSESVDYPCAVPLVIQGMNEGCNLGIDISLLMSDKLNENLDYWINSKVFTTTEINIMMGTHNAKELISAKGMDRTSMEVACLYKAMQNNSICLVQDWKPIASVYMMHSIDDETVPFINAQLAKNAWADCNITYNFGHYGSHVNTALRFIFTVLNILKSEK